MSILTRTGFFCRKIFLSGGTTLIEGSGCNFLNSSLSITAYSFDCIFSYFRWFHKFKKFKSLVLFFMNSS